MAGREPEDAHNVSRDMSDPESTQSQRPAVQIQSPAKGSPGSFVEAQKPQDASAKSLDDMESAHANHSNTSMTTTKKRSTIQRIKDFHTQRRSERFYRFLNHDLPMGIKVIGGEFLCTALAFY